MESTLRRWLQEVGFGPAADLAPLQAGLGSTSLWTFTLDTGERLVARVFSAGDTVSAQREVDAMRAARTAGVPVPPVHAVAEVHGQPVILTGFVGGVSVFQALQAEPHRARALGTSMGLVLGQIHRLTAPASLTTLNRDWVVAGGDALAPLRSRLGEIAVQNRLLHLDYHPLNVLVEGDAISGVIDWENARSGPPHIDLARTRTILQVSLLAGLVPPEARPVIAEFERSLVAGHTEVAGPDPHPDLSAAWALAFTLADLTAQSTKPGTTFTAAVLAHLTTLRDTAIATAG